jgi:uncharacterized membrane protein YfcA
VLSRLIGYIILTIGLVLGVFGGVGWFVASQQAGRTVAIFFGVLGVLLLLIGYRWSRPKRRYTSWRSDPATDRQRAFATELGIKFPKKISKGELSDLISEVTGE